MTHSDTKLPEREDMIAWSERVLAKAWNGDPDFLERRAQELDVFLKALAVYQARQSLLDRVTYLPNTQ